MLNQAMLEGNWNQIKGQLRSRWGELTDDELDQAHGSLEQLLGIVQRKTGSTRSEIERYLEEVTDDQGQPTEHSYVHEASERAQKIAQQAAEAAMEQYSQTQRMVRRHPLESLGVCFGVGVITGVVVGLTLRR